jgi:hypothetical protein
MGEMYLQEYETSLMTLFSGGEYEPVGYISFAAARKVNAESLELSWYVNVFDRFHEVPIVLPRDQFITCVGCWRYDEKPHIFVKDTWLESVHVRLYSVFGLVDAIGVKEAILDASLSRDKLIQLRDAIDELARDFSEVSFISFADSVLLKSNWSVGYVNSGIQYTYHPEVFFKIIKAFQSIYKQTLGLDVYAILTQGSNEYYKDDLLHISESKNHICLNSLGVPFAELMAIDERVRISIKTRLHEPAEVYMDQMFFRSLKFNYRSDIPEEDVFKNIYTSKMTTKEGYYYYGRCQYMLDRLT